MRASTLRFFGILLLASFCGCITQRHDRTQVKQNDCGVCHMADYDATTNPIHLGVFPTTCGMCHVETAWVPVHFDHPWPLTGAHAPPSGPACSACHTGTPPRWAGTPTECVGCHRADYDASPYPNHQTFPTTCDDCHSTTAWKPALEGRHPESSFPIRSGNHQGIVCTNCHDPNRGPSTDGANTTCIGCHTHDLGRMNEKHREVRNYSTFADPSRPNFCLGCHPRG